MARLYLASSYKNRSEAVAIADWMRARGWDVSVGAGDDPETATPATPGEAPDVSACDAALFLVSGASLDDDGFTRRFRRLRAMGKRLFCALIDTVDIAAAPAAMRADGLVTLLADAGDGDVLPVLASAGHGDADRAFSVEALNKLHRAMAAARVDPLSFDWPPEQDKRRSCYRGLQPLADVDAGVFFGRDVALRESLDHLRKLSRDGSGGVFILAGGAGAGKSSFLEAGLIPRLRRDSQSFSILPVIRPGGGGLFGPQGLAKAIGEMARPNGEAPTAAQIAEALRADANALRPLLSTPTGDATLVVAVDQAEELFLSAHAEENRHLLTLLTAMAEWDDPGLVVIYATRASALDALQHATRAQRRRPVVFTLPALSREELAAIVEGPIARLPPERRREIAPPLRDALLDDAERIGAPALPLLAFTLERLLRVGGRDAQIGMDAYLESGRLADCLDRAGARALSTGADANAPQDAEMRLSLLRRGLIPWLAGLDLRAGTPLRRVAAMRDIPAVSLPLIERLEQERLIARVPRDDSPEGAFMLAHDALFAHWRLLTTFMSEEPRLGLALERLEEAACEWENHDRSPEWIVHSGTELEKAERIYAQPEALAHLGARERAYLVACREAQNGSRDTDATVELSIVDAQQRKTDRVLKGSERARRSAWLAWIAATAAACVAGLAISGWRASLREKSDAEARLARAEASIDGAIAGSNRLIESLLQKLATANGEQAGLVRDVTGGVADVQEKLDGPEASSGKSRRNQSAGLNMLARARLATGDATGALGAAQKSVSLMQGLVASDSSNAGWRRDLSVSYATLGDAQLAAGDASGALASYRADLTIARTLASSAPDNAQWRFDLSVSCEKLGDALMAKGETAKALEAYAESRTIREALLAANPGNKTWERNLAISYERLGTALAKQSDVAGATAAFEGALEIYQKLARADPADVQTLVFSVVPRWRLAALDPRTARERLTPALEILEKLAAEGRLAEDKRDWLTQVKTGLAALDRALVQTP